MRLACFSDIHGNPIALDAPYPSVADVQANPSLVPRVVEVAYSFALTMGYLTAGGWLDWQAALSDAQLRTTANGVGRPCEC